MDGAWCGVRACFSEFAGVLPRAFLATKGSLMGDGVGLLAISRTTSGGALTELAPRSFAILWAAVLIAGLLIHFAIFVVACFTTTFRLHRNREGPLFSSNGTIATAILAFFSALVKFAP